MRHDPRLYVIQRHAAIPRSPGVIEIEATRQSNAAALGRRHDMQVLGWGFVLAIAICAIIGLGTWLGWEFFL